MYQLDQYQKIALKTVKQKKHLFLTGSAGTGKTHTLKQIISILYKYNSNITNINVLFNFL